MLSSFYKDFLLKYPKRVLLLLSIFFIGSLFFALKLEIDASSDTLLLDGDKDLEYTRQIGERFGSQDILFVTYTIKEQLLSKQNIENIKNLSKKLQKFKQIESITSIVNVPLLQSPIKPLKETVKKINTLEDVDKELAKKEFLNSPIYKENLVSKDFKTTALLITLKRDEKYFDLQKSKELNKRNKEKLQNIKKELKEYRDKSRIDNHNLILGIRTVLEEFEKEHKVKLHLGGANMIADDMVEFVKRDLNNFGFLIILLLVVILYILFKEKKWVFVSLFICTVSIIITSGLFGLLGWEITVISSNFISLQLIMNISLVVHLIIKYKELLSLYPNTKQKELLIKTATSMSKPSFFVVITTIAGFSSLVYSGILPVITFGWMMSAGIVVSLLVTFILFPITLLFFKKSEFVDIKKRDKPFTLKIANFALNNQKVILVASFLVMLFFVTGSSKLRVENSFIDYFKKDTQIYQGMSLIDKKLGGTTPLDVILTFKQNDEIESIKIEQNDEDQFLDEFAEEFEQTKEDKEKYWFTKEKIEKIRLVHNYLESLQPVGKVLSLATLTKVGKLLNEGKELDGLMLALINKELPLKYKKVILYPYVDIKNNQARISTRIIDSQKGLKRDNLLKKIDKDIKNILDEKYQDYKISNLLVIYNNMLQSLFDSQIKTIGVVVLILFVMFLLLFRSLKIAIVAIFTNIISVGVIFGFMGWFDIPLDLMTITIAAISIGIAVDDTIHYIHRFLLEQKSTKNIANSIKASHKSIGTAMFYTSSVIIVGFSVLLASNFTPTIYFGLLTVIAMFTAIVADLFLLPVLLVLFKIRG